MQIASVTALVLMLPGAALLLLLERVLKAAMRAILGNRMTQEPAQGE